MAIKHYKPGETPTTARPGGIIIAFGHPSVGKSLFGVKTEDVAETLFYANLDRDANHLIKQYTGKGGVYYDEFSANSKASAEKMMTGLTEMKNAAVAHCLQGNNAVFVLDNFAHFYELVQLGLLDEGNTRMGALAYGPINAYIRDYLLTLERTPGLWTIITAPAKEVWETVTNEKGVKQGKATGLFEPDGWKHADFHVVGEIWLYAARPVGATPNPAATTVEIMPGAVMPAIKNTLEYKGQIVLSKRRPQVEGIILNNPTLHLMLRVMKEIE